MTSWGLWKQSDSIQVFHLFGRSVVGRPPASEGGASLVLRGWTQWPDTSGHCVPASAPVLHFNPYSTVDITASIYNGQPSTIYNGQPSTLYNGQPSTLYNGQPSTLYNEQPSIRPATHPVSASSETFLPNAFLSPTDEFLVEWTSPRR